MDGGGNQGLECFDARAKGRIFHFEIGEYLRERRRRLLILDAVGGVAREQIPSLLVLGSPQIGHELLEIPQKLPRLCPGGRDSDQISGVIKGNGPDYDKDYEAQAEYGSKFGGYSSAHRLVGIPKVSRS